MPKLKAGELQMNWPFLLKQMLLEAGTVGKTVGEINKRFNKVPPEEINMELEALWAEEQVQRFTQRTHGVSATIWRATDKLND